MPRVKNRWARGLIAWSLLLLVVAIVVAFDASRSLYDAQQACFFQSGAVPCPGPGDPKAVQLTVAFVGVPVIWLMGLLIGIAGWAAQRIRRPRT